MKPGYITTTGRRILDELGRLASCMICILLADEFTRADSTDLGSNWVEFSGNWEILSNQLKANNTGLVYTQVGIPVARRNVRVTAKNAQSGKIYQLCIAVAADGSDYICIELNCGATLATVSLKMASGTVIHSFDFTYTPGNDYTLYACVSDESTYGGISELLGVFEEVEVTVRGCTTAVNYPRAGIANTGTAAEYDNFGFLRHWNDVHNTTDGCVACPCECCCCLHEYWLLGLIDPANAGRVKITFTGAIRGEVILRAREVVGETLCFNWDTLYDGYVADLEDDCEFAIGGGNLIAFACDDDGTNSQTILDTTITLGIGSATCSVRFLGVDPSSSCDPFHLVFNAESANGDGVCPCGDLAPITMTVELIDYNRCDTGLSGDSSLTFTTSGNLTGTGDLTGTTSIDFSASGLLSSIGDMTGTTGISFSQSANLTATGDMTGTTGISFTTTGAMSSPGELTGTTGITFSQSGSLTGAGNMTGATGISFMLSDALTGVGSLTGTTGIAFTLSGGMTAAIDMVGTSSLSFSLTGGLTGVGNLVGSSDLTFSLSGGLTGIGNLTGTTGITFTVLSSCDSTGGEECCGCACLNQYWSDGVANPGTGRLQVVFTGALRGTVILSPVSDTGVCFRYTVDDVTGLLEDDCEFAIGGSNVIEFTCVDTATSLSQAILSVAAGSADCIIDFLSIGANTCNPLSVVANLESQESAGSCPCGDAAAITATITAIDTWPC